MPKGRGMGAAVYRVVVGVCLARPPRVDEYRMVMVVAGSGLEALLVATQISACTSEMPVGAELVAGPVVLVSDVEC